MKQQCKDASVCPANALPGSDYCAHHTGKPRGADLEIADLIGDDGGDDDSRRRSHRFVLPPPALDREALLPFEVRGGWTLMASPQKPFKPRGLMLWNAAHLSVEAMVIGVTHQVVASFAKVPALWFMTSQNYEQVVAARAEGKEPGQGWGSWDAVYPGMLVRLDFDGPAADVKALMWGYST